MTIANFNIADQRLMIPKILISISATNPTYILHTMPKDIEEHMRALIAQHGSALAALAALRQQPEAQQNDEQTDFLENPVPRRNASVEFNQDTSKSTCECCNRLHKERCAKLHTELARPFETPQDRSNCLRQERQTVQ
jgi:hypothetical protein